jgi:signal transduction histidine kinase
VTKDPNFPRASLAKNIGVKAGFAFPILIGDEIVGVMEFFSSEAVEPDGKLLEIMTQVGTQLGRVLERKRAEEEVRHSHEQLRNLYRRLELVREEERTRMSREIHDELAQALTALKMEISLLDKKLAKQNSSLQSSTQMMLEILDTTIQAGKKLVMDLRPPILDDFGLPEAIEWQAIEFENRTGIQCDVDLYDNDFVLDKERSTTLFRIFQETLTNVTRHAQADKININLKGCDASVTLQVRDNGIGITEEQIKNSRSLGLLGIRERALVWGGKVVIMGTPNEGTIVTIKLKR